MSSKKYKYPTAPIYQVPMAHFGSSMHEKRRRRLELEKANKTPGGLDNLRATCETDTKSICKTDTKSICKTDTKSRREPEITDEMRRIVATEGVEMLRDTLKWRWGTPWKGVKTDAMEVDEIKNEESECFSHRPQKIVLCQECGYTADGNIKVKNPQHPKIIPLHDLENCAHCGSSHLIEKDTKDEKALCSRFQYFNIGV